MHGKMIFVLLLSGYIFTKAVATTTPEIGVTTSASLSANGSIPTTPSGPKTNSPSMPVPTTEKEEVITVIIYSVMAVIIGIILISAQLIGLLIKRNPTPGTSDPLTSVKIGETERIQIRDTEVKKIK
ncbi:glycophorin-A isoform X4 [Neophocaena asiaeorientalis asiaeorientalis]|uniref:Glycophorin-A n=1 Tax=Neophocaena asiaeorientalis asiaeorientalis TaxID=1706337 RepID=A0A341ARQ8_NEOAA|nr:glycophorin-A isoform X4 [Neophocaena asiaeorientalis asiaeorientalis]